MVAGRPLTISLIVAVAANGVIGREGKLPWRLGSDLKRFRTLTMGHPLIMGRQTFESIGKPLDGRDMIVVTSKAGVPAAAPVYLVSTLENALTTGAQRAEERGVDEIFIIGGAQIFSHALPLAHRIYLTRVHGSPEGDVRWEPDLSSGWVEQSRTDRPPSSRDEFGVTDLILERKRA